MNKTIRTSRKSRRFAIGSLMLALALTAFAPTILTPEQKGNQPEPNRAQQAFLQQLGNQPGYNELGNQPDNRAQQANFYAEGAGSSAGGPVHTDPSAYLLGPVHTDPSGYLTGPVHTDPNAYL